MHASLALNPVTIDTPLVEENISMLCKQIYYNWKNDATFGYYLLEEKPSHHEYLCHDLLSALEKDSKHHILYIIRNQTYQNVGYILLKNYSSVLCDDPVHQKSYLPQQPFSNIEVSYRALQKGVCARSLYVVLKDYLSRNPHVQGFLGHHAIENKASGLVFQQNGFAGLRYHQNYVYLPNIQEWSDTIMWVLQKDQYIQDINTYSDYLHLKNTMKTNNLRTHNIPHESHDQISDWYQKIHPIVDQKSLLSSMY